jgi:hypothetical protein
LNFPEIQYFQKDKNRKIFSQMSKNIAKLNLFPLPHTRPPLFSKKPLDKDINNDTRIIVTEIEDILAQMRKNPKGIRFNDLCRVCNCYFGKAKAYQVNKYSGLLKSWR